jgi:hypothetical protein
MARLDEMPPYKMSRLDPAKISRAVLPAYLNRLAVLRMVDRAADVFEQVGYRKDLESAWR